MRELSCFVIIPSNNQDTTSVQVSKDARWGLSSTPSGCTPAPNAPEAVNFDDVYHQIIETAVTQVNVRNPGVRIACVRGQDIKQPGDIIYHMMKQICAADITITDITTNNPNVFLEYGIRLSVKDSFNILIHHKLAQIPFNIGHLRAIPYGTDLAAAGKALKEIDKFLQEYVDGKVGNEHNKYYESVDLFTSRLMEQRLAAVCMETPKLIAALAAVALAKPQTAKKFRREVFEFLSSVQKALSADPGGQHKVIEHLKLVSEIKGIEKSRLKDTYYELAKLCGTDDMLKKEAKQYLQKARALED